MGKVTDDGGRMRLIGGHTVDNGRIHMAAPRAGSAGMRALQVFTAIPKSYGDKSMIRPERVTRFLPRWSRPGSCVGVSGTADRAALVSARNLL